MLEDRHEDEVDDWEAELKYDDAAGRLLHRFVLWRTWSNMKMIKVYYETESQMMRDKLEIVGKGWEVVDRGSEFGPTGYEMFWVSYRLSRWT